jgi:myo-inositol-1(or 4)-monophosphatase
MELLARKRKTRLTQRRLCLVLDPLDGTTNFTAGLPAFAISMGLCFRGVPVLGDIAVPWEGPTGTIFRAHQGGGAYCNDVAMQVAGAEVPAGTRLTSMPFWALWQYRVRRRSGILQTNGRAAGSIAYELAYAARGTFQWSIIAARGCGIWWPGRCWCRKRRDGPL